MAGASSPPTVTCASSGSKEVYNWKAVIPHAASLHQASAHCAIFPTAASRRSLGRVSVPVWPVALSGRLPVVALVGHHPTNKLIGREPIPDRKTFHFEPCSSKSYPVLAPVSEGYPKVQGRLLTCYSPVRRSSTPKGLSARLACVKHAASVRPEPGSNSPTKTVEKLSRQQTNVAKGIQAGSNRPGKILIGTGFTSTLLSSQRTTAPEVIQPSGHSLNFTLALPLRQIPEIPAKCERKSSSPAKISTTVNRAISEGSLQDGRCGDPSGPLALARLPGGSENVTGCRGRAPNRPAASRVTAGRS